MNTNAAKFVSAYFSGLLFGLGLIVAGMANPAKVLGFLDLAGRWDPSLAFVMIGAIGVGFFAFRAARRRRAAVLGDAIEWPRKTALDGRLIGGSLVFGIGWGLAGVCPGPAFVLLGFGIARAWIFVAAMLAGLYLAGASENFRAKSAALESGQ